MELYLNELKTKIQGFGAVRPEAWESIVEYARTIHLKAQQSFQRKPGTFAYVAEGLLKEYDVQNRLTPSIINFISSGQCLITRKYNQRNYLKAGLPTFVYYWDFDELQKLYQEFKELKTIYDELCAIYDEQTTFRQQVLEEHHAAARVMLFRMKYKTLLPFLKKKDMASYVQMTYNHFLKAYNDKL
jgi:hypothetical protein